MSGRLSRLPVLSALALGLVGTQCNVVLGLDKYVDTNGNGSGGAGAGTATTTTTSTTSSSHATGSGGATTTTTSTTGSTSGQTGTGGTGGSSATGAGGESCTGNACGGAVWDLVFDDSNGETVNSVAADSVGDIYYAGTFNYILGVDGQMFPDAQPSTGNSQYYLLKFDHVAPHHLLWHKLLGDDLNGGNGGYINIAVDTNDNVIIAGELRSTIDFGGGALKPPAGATDAIFLAKYDSAGTYAWSNVFGAPTGSFATTVTTDSTGNIIIGGNWYGGTLNFGTTVLPAPAKANFGFVAGFSSSGTNVWSTAFSDGSTTTSTSAVAGVASVAVAPKDPTSIYVSGSFDEGLKLGSYSFSSKGGSADVFLAKFDPTGNPTWVQTYGSPQADSGGALSVNAAGDVLLGGANGGVITIGTTTLQNAGSFAAVVTALGAPVWTKTVPSSLLLFDPSGDIFYTGGGVNVGRLDGAGETLWSKTFTISSGTASAVNALAVDPSTGNAVLAGTLQGTISFGLAPITGAFNAYLVELQD